MTMKTYKFRWGRLLTALVVLGLVGATACSSTPAATPTAASTEAASVAPTTQPTTAAPATTPAAPGAMPAAPAARDGMYSAPPAMTIDPAKYYVATIETEHGNIVVQLFPDKAPNTVNNFVFLARQGFYDNTTFHRVMPGFMAQAGDPTGTGFGGPGYTFADEFDITLTHDRVGTLSSANSGPDTNGSQFFITYGPAPWLDGQHTVFGRVIDGLDALLAIRERDPETATTPGDLIRTITITESTTPPVSQLPANADIPMPADPAARNNMYPRPFTQVIDPDQTYRATIHTAKGDIVAELNAQAAPATVNNFVALARAGFYDGLTFHRVEPGFVIQGGDPLGSGQGGSGYITPAEISLTHTQGAIAMARLPDQGNPLRMSSGSQFYITLDATPMLDGQYTVFGYVVEGMDVVQSIAVGDVIQSVTIGE